MFALRDDFFEEKSAAEKFGEVFSACNGYSVSWDAKKEHDDQEIVQNILYGEAVFESLRDIFCNDMIANEMQDAKVFYDLGSGTGNVLAGLALMNVFEKCKGIELLGGLYAKSVENLKKLRQIDEEAANKIEVFNDSFLNHDFSDADVIYANHPTKDAAIQTALEEKFQNLKEGAIVIYVIHSLENRKNFRFLGTRRVKFSWGEATCYYYRKEA
jgi:SAM-dependent methyltransferase